MIAYSLYDSVYDTSKETVQDERNIYLMSSLMPLHLLHITASSMVFDLMGHGSSVVLTLVDQYYNIDHYIFIDSI
jgi:hypothetical protein